MGFRSTFTTEDYPIKWPEWLREKYANAIWFNADGVGPLHSIHEAKTYGLWAGLEKDIQTAIDWNELRKARFVLVYLHECGGITRCQIEKDAIKYSEPETWRTAEEVTHNYCYGCSDI